MEREISDCKEGSTDEEWEEDCQNLLLANHGMNTSKFLALLEFIGERRKRALADDKIVISFDGYKFGPQHLAYDLMKVREVLGQVKRTLPKVSHLRTRCEQILEMLM